MKISKFGLKATFLFVLFCLLGKILFPFGDEPDFIVRADELTKSHYFWNIYIYFPSITDEINRINFDLIAQPFTSFWNTISTNGGNFLTFNFLRFCVQIFIFLPFFYAVVFRSAFIRSMRFFMPSLTVEQWNRRLDCLSITFVFSGIVYYTGVFSIEQFTLVLTLYIFMFWGNYLLVSLFFLLVAFIDLGNSVVLFTFIILGVYCDMLAKRNKYRSIYFSMGILIILAFIMGISLLSYMESIPLLAEKSKSMAALEEQGNYRDKYPIVLRPFITIMTAIFLTPSGIKVFFTFILFLFGGIKLYIKILTNQKTKEFLENKKISIAYIAAGTTILFFVFLFPNYGNAKYYIFTSPFFIFPLLNYYSRERILAFFCFSNAILFLHLMLYRL